MHVFVFCVVILVTLHMYYLMNAAHNVLFTGQLSVIVLYC